MNSNIDKVKALFAITLSTIIIGLSYVFVKVGVKSASPLDLLSDRLAIAGILLFILRYSRFLKINKVTKREKMKIIGFSLLYPIGFFTFQILGIMLIPASEASIVYATLPIFTLLISAIVLKEKTTLHQKAGIVLSVGGVFYITLQSSGNLTSNYWGYLFILCSLLLIVFYYIFLKKNLQRASVVTITYYLLLYSAFLIGIINIFRWIIAGMEMTAYFQRFTDPGYICAILFLGILSTFMTSFLTNYSLSHLSVNLVGVFNNLSPIIGLFAGVFFLHESLYDYYLYGGIAVLIGITISSTVANKTKRWTK